MTSPSLFGPTRPPASGKPPKQLFIFLHGLGANGEDLIDLAPFFARAYPDAAFVSPDAPFPCDMAPFGYQWFSLQDRDPAIVLAGAQKAVPLLDHFIDAQLKLHNVSDDKLVLVGFSQGTMMALYVALRRAHPCAAVIGFSGALLGAELLAKEIKSRPPVCLIHGDADGVVPHGASLHAAQLLTAAGVPVEFHSRPNLAHGIDNEGLALALRFLKEKTKL